MRSAYSWQLAAIAYQIRQLDSQQDEGTTTYLTWLRQRRALTAQYRALYARQTAEQIHEWRTTSYLDDNQLEFPL